MKRRQLRTAVSKYQAGILWPVLEPLQRQPPALLLPDVLGDRVHPFDGEESAEAIRLSRRGVARISLHMKWDMQDPRTAGRCAAPTFCLTSMTRS